MKDANLQILSLAREGLNAEEISSALGYPVEAVNVVLVQNPKQVAALSTAGSPEELEQRFASMQTQALDVLHAIMLGANGAEISPELQAKIAMYITDQRLGLKKAAKTNQQINIVMIKDEILKAKQLRQSITIDEAQSVAA